jgi:hypothetical protein
MRAPARVTSRTLTLLQSPPTLNGTITSGKFDAFEFV